MLINISTAERITKTELVNRYKNVSFPVTLTDAILAPFGYAILRSTTPPSYDSWAHRLVEGTPEHRDEKWWQTWALEPVTHTQEEEAEHARQQVEQQKTEYTAAVQQRLDEFARTRNYDSIFTACTYATSTTEKFRVEGQYCVTARDATWSKCYEILAAVESGGRSAPTLTELLAELPTLAWPDITDNVGA